ncbi:MAG: BMC domain-containing protein [Anaerolineae bacterium]
MKPAIALVETNSIAQGVLVGDAMVKKANVQLYEARSICPGKYMVLVGGEVGPVEESYREGIAVAQDTLVDQLFLPNAHPDIFPALMSAMPPGGGEALGIIETVTAAVCIVAADAAAKAAEIRLMEIRLANGLGGKSFVLLEGDVSNVEAAMQAGVKPASQEGLLVRSVIIPQLHRDMRDKIL